MNMMRPPAARTILVCSPAVAGDIRALPGWADRFDETVAGGLDALAGRYDVLVPTDDPRRPVFAAAGARIGYLCTELAGFEAAMRHRPAGDVVFMPSPLARLDLLVRDRRTLRAARALVRGTVLGPDDLEEEVGGPGVGAAFTDRLVGRSALYDLPAGAPLDFGVVG
ncbi:SAF domain-containing protein [Azospirillum halopraeferens]|uniref:SAF domain-containing protein n=1 Tax=Azospirillum halopraeferens TaxID=34010 RepID=UPI00041E08EB|nr:SAF domain-containing protein [Azospirillum halopraeferens]